MSSLPPYALRIIFTHSCLFSWLHRDLRGLPGPSLYLILCFCWWKSKKPTHNQSKSLDGQQEHSSSANSKFMYFHISKKNKHAKLRDSIAIVYGPVQRDAITSRNQIRGMQYSNETAFCIFSPGQVEPTVSEVIMPAKKLEQSEKLFHLVEFIKGLFELCIKQLIKAAGHLVLWSTAPPHPHCHWLARSASQVAFCPALAKPDWTPAPWGPVCAQQSYSRPASVVPAHIAPRLCDTGEAQPLSLPLSQFYFLFWKWRARESRK